MWSESRRLLVGESPTASFHGATQPDGTEYTPQQPEPEEQEAVAPTSQDQQAREVLHPWRPWLAFKGESSHGQEQIAAILGGRVHHGGVIVPGGFGTQDPVNVSPAHTSPCQAITLS